MLTLWATLSFCLSAVAILPKYTTRTWRKNNGLPDDEITGLCQDKNGYLWITTPTSLARFDGTQFIAFEPTPAEFRSPSGYNSISLDNDNSLLLAPKTGGLLRLTQGRFVQHPLPSKFANRIVTGVLRADDGALWICVQGGVAIRQQDGQEQIYELGPGANPDGSMQVVHDGTGRVWLTNGTALARYENAALVTVPVRNEKELLNIASARQDGPWVFSDERLFKIIENKPVEIAKTNGYTTAHYIQSIREDPSGDLWMGTRFRGLRRLRLGGDTLHVIENPGDITAVLVDSSGNVWAGSNGSGLIRVRPGIIRYFDKSAALVETYSPTVCQDNEGTMWFANRDGGVAFLTETDRPAFPEMPKKWENFSAFSVSPATTGGVWATSSHGLLKADRTSLQQNPGPKSETATRVTFTAHDGSLWLALGPGKLGRLHESEWSCFGSEHGLNQSVIRAIAEDKQGHLWIGCDDASLFRLEDEHFTRIAIEAPTPIGAIQAIHFDLRNNCWAGTEHSGLLHLDNGLTYIINKQSGLPSNNITQIMSDDIGAIWLGSPDGIFHVQQSELQDYIENKTKQVYPVSIGADEGVSEATCYGLYQPSVWKSTKGLVWFATRQGILVIDPRREKMDHTALTVQIQAVHADGRPYEFSPKLQIDSKVHNLELSFSALCLSTPKRVRIRYRLHGFDDEWRTSDASNVVRYTRLPPGEYVFEVSALLAGVSGSETHSSLAVVIKASWWQSLWFRSAILFLSALLVALAGRKWSHKRLREKLDKLERDSALEQERARIARNIHDDLGAGLTRISLLTQSSQNGNGVTQLDKIYNTVSELTQTMDEIVWAVNPKNDDLENLANYLSDFAQNFLSDSGIRCRVLLPELLPKRAVPAQHRHHIYMACKEALNNIAKHAHASEVTLQLSFHSDQLTIAIADNGCGLHANGKEHSTTHKNSGNGLANMQTRLSSLGGTCEIASPLPGGTTVTFKASLQH